MLHVRQSTETICQLSGMGASDTKTSSIHGSDDVEVNYRGTLTNLSKTKNTNRKRKGQTERDGVPIRLQDSCQQMGLMNSGSCILDSCHVLQQEFQGKLGSKSRAQDILWCSAEYGEMGQLNSVFPIHDGFYGNQQASEFQGQLGFRAPAVHSSFNIRNSLQEPLAFMAIRQSIRTISTNRIS
ncbi:protein FAR-RED ELONGATED HYPOCOTYL 3-like isoform X3 [Argentina anserina]|uniref:protein FAR-RED ELONGATED HYPOCOTYL 3-like isoform X3 n=1 Tax=Argentina anserina TaxID=57926 RepID=UPI0021763904|nr:protein FAR-RED ELONGATED HYPOCOTYL 3-like isoform X3 [Potentilla anserina]